MENVNQVKIKMETRYPDFTKSEKKIADYIKLHYAEVIYASVSELAEFADVGETTIFRFCKKMGYKGYPELKLELAQDLVTMKQSDTDDNRVTHFSEKIQNNIIEKIHECYASLDVEVLNRAIRCIDKAHRLFFFGIGSSGISASIAKERFLRIGVVSDTAVDAHKQNIVASILNQDDVIVAFSLSGVTKDVCESLEIAKRNGVTIILATSYIKSRMTKFADIILQTAGKENYMEAGALVSSVSQLYIIDLLFTGVCLLNKDRSLEMRKETGRSIISKSI